MQIHWRNKTLRDFFAALWLVRYSDGNERSQAIQNIPKDLGKFYSGMSIAPEYQELWSFVSTMPPGAMVTGHGNDHQRWLQLIAALFVQPTEHPRPSEMMARAWPRLPKLSEGDLPASLRAKQIIAEFLGEFVAMQTAEPTKGIIEQDLVFKTIKLKGTHVEVEVGHYEMDGFFKNNPQHKEKLAGTYVLSKYPITRRLYDCFDPNHIDFFESEFGRYASEDRCPVICVNYWDAWMFSVWCGGRLPTEWEWEYACRANCRDKDNRLSLYYWPDDNEGKQLKDHAWCNSNSDQKTHPVGMLKSNEFGLHDMLGGVWEWTESTYEQRVSRVLRGGVYNNGLLSDTGSASVSFRFFNYPSDAGNDIGFRVARAP